MLVSAQSSLIDLVNTFSADKRALNTFYNNKESEEYYQRFTKLYNDWDKKIESIDFEKLTQQEKVDYLLLKNLITKESYFLNIDYKAFKEVAYVTDFTKNVYPFIIERRRGKKPDAQALATTLHTASKTVEKENKDISEKPFKNWLMAEKAKTAF